MNKIAAFGLCKLSDIELMEKVDQMTDKMFIDQKVPTMHIPARPDADYDLLIGELILRFKDKIENPDSHKILGTFHYDFENQKETYTPTPTENIDDKTIGYSGGL